jgi:phosphotransferase system HPr (HPr) family protein
MVRKTVVIVNELGLHARPAAKVAKLAQRYRAKVFLKKGQRKAEAASILDVLSLACSQGTELEILAEGEEASEAVEAIATLLEELEEL